MACPNCDSDNWLTHGLFIGDGIDRDRHYCLDCDHEWRDEPAAHIDGADNG